MVAIRNAHIVVANKNFSLIGWVDNLNQESKTAEKLIQVYRECEILLNGNEQKDLLLWRGREMIDILTTLSMDEPTLIAAQLFPMVSNGFYDKETLKENYSKEIIKLIDGVTEMATIGQLSSDIDDNTSSGQVDNIRRMLLAMVDDFRCVVIKLAERIAYLREVKDQSDEIRRSVAKECANIYSPLANRLGIGQLKWELEDYAFRFQHPETYKQIANQLSERRIVREQYIEYFVTDLEQEIKNLGINAEVHGRPKPRP